MVRCGTKENPSDLGTKVLQREAMASCMSKLAIVPVSTLRGAIVAGPGTSDQRERRSDCGRVLFETSGKHDNWSGEHG